MNLREIDRLVAKKVMGWNLSNLTTPYFSSNIADAWRVVERLRERKIFFLQDAWDENDNKIFYANFQYMDGYTFINYDAYAKTPQLAICLAALKAVGVEVEVNEQ